jgi:stage II sporulation protein D
MKNMRYKSISVLVICCMIFCFMFFTSQEATAYTTPEYIKVGLRYGSTAVESCKISSETGFKLGNITSEGFEETLPLPAYTELIAGVENDHVVLKDPDGVLISSDIGINGCLMPTDYQEDGLIAFESNKFRGGLMLSVDKNNKLKVINYLTLDEYLYGVLHMEMSQSYPIEALKAQAVAARSFAVQSIGRHSADGFDVCTSTHCQVYGGYRAEYPRTCQAVDETSGLLVWSQGKPVPTFYCKNSGGHTQNVEDVWSQPMSYLIGKPDPYSPDYPWSTTITFDVLEKKLSKAGYNSGPIQYVKIGGRNSSGAVSKLLIVGNQSTVTLEKEKIRNVLGATVVKSTHFNIESDKIEPEIPSSKIDLNLSNGSRNRDAGETVYVLSAGNNLETYNTADIYLSNGSRTVKARVIPASDSGDSNNIGKVIITGKGCGHGVGMAQDGAIEMAKQGFTFKEILQFYFTDIEVR